MKQDIMTDWIKTVKRNEPDYLEAFEYHLNQAIGLNAKYNDLSKEWAGHWSFFLYCPAEYVKILKDSRRIVIGSLIINFDGYNVTWGCDRDNTRFIFQNKANSKEEISFEFQILRDDLIPDEEWEDYL